jgi:hypothetical protein
VSDKPSGEYWCCKADFGEHEPTCKNYVAGDGKQQEARFVREWYEFLKERDPYHFEAHDIPNTEFGYACEYTFEKFSNCPMVKGALEVLAARQASQPRIRTIATVIAEWRAYHSDDDAQLASAINYYIATEVTPGEIQRATQPSHASGEPLPCGHAKRFWFDVGESVSESGIKLPQTWICVLCELTKQFQRGQQAMAEKAAQQVRSTIQELCSQVALKAFPATPHDESEACVTLVDLQDIARSLAGAEPKNKFDPFVHQVCCHCGHSCAAEPYQTVYQRTLAAAAKFIDASQYQVTGQMLLDALGGGEPQQDKLQVRFRRDFTLTFEEWFKLWDTTKDAEVERLCGIAWNVAQAQAAIDTPQEKLTEAAKQITIMWDESCECPAKDFNREKWITQVLQSVLSREPGASERRP